MKSSRRDIDEMALNSILRTPQPQRAPLPSSTYGRKDVDDMVRMACEIGKFNKKNQS